VALTAPGDSLVGQSDEFLAAAAHLDGNVAQASATETEAGGLLMIRAPQIAQFAGGLFLELFKPIPRHWRHKSILA
jgi:hypothetical protein